MGLMMRLSAARMDSEVRAIDMLIKIVVKVILYAAFAVCVMKLFELYKDWRNARMNRDEYGVLIVLEKKRGEECVHMRFAADAEVAEMTDLQATYIAMLTDGIVEIATNNVDADKVKAAGVDEIAEQMAGLVSAQIKMTMIERFSEVVARDGGRRMK